MDTSIQSEIIKDSGDAECSKEENLVSKNDPILYLVDEKKNVVLTTSVLIEGTGDVKKHAGGPEQSRGTRGQQIGTPQNQQQAAGGQQVYVVAYTSDRAQEPTRMYTSRGRDPFQRQFSPDESIFDELFNETAIRNKFIHRVYTILTVQLLYTCGFIALCIYEPNIKKFIVEHQILLICALVMELTVFMPLVCCVSARRIFPLNFILLGLFTISFAYIMAFVSALTSTEIVIMSMGITAGVSLVISLFACTTSFDMTGCAIFLYIFGMIICIFGFTTIIVMLVSGPNKMLFLVYAALIALLFSLYLMFDTQMIIGGRRIELSPEEYIFGALTLYVDIMEIFWAVLQLFANCDQ